MLDIRIAAALFLRRQRGLLAGFLAVSFLFHAAMAIAQTSTPVDAAVVHARLDHPVALTWTNQPFRTAMHGLSDTLHVAVLIDRRIDPNVPLTLAIGGEPLRLAIERIAAARNVGSSVTGPVIYFGPPEVARSLRTVVEKNRLAVGKLPPGPRKLMTHMKPMKWDDLAEPRAMLDDLAKEARVKIVNPEAITHDLWPANHLPALPWCDRLSLIAAQFGKSYTVAEDGESIEFVTFPKEAKIEKEYPAGSTVEQRKAQLAKQFSDAAFTVRDGRLIALASSEDHEHIAALLAGKKTHTTTVKRGKDLYKLSVQSVPLDKVLAQLATMLKLEIRYDDAGIDAAQISRGQLVTFDVKDATLDELLAAVLKGTGLKFDRKESVVTIGPAG